MLSYTRDKILETQTCDIERDMGKLDAFGGEPKLKREIVHEKIRCRFWWWREGGARSPSKEYATPQRSIEFTGGAALFEAGTDIRDQDHIANVFDEEGNLYVEGPFRVVAVLQWPSHTEAALMRP